MKTSFQEADEIKDSRDKEFLDQFKNQEEYLKWIEEQVEKCGGVPYPEDEEVFWYGK